MTRRDQIDFGAVVLGVGLIAAGLLGVGNSASASPSPAASGVPQVAKPAPATPTIAYQCTGESFLLFDNWNGDIVANGGASPTFNTGDKKYCLAAIATYHWNFSAGKVPGTIGVVAASGTASGQWQAAGSAGQNNAPNVNWTAFPKQGEVVVLDGAFKCIDSDPGTWATNKTSAGLGFCRVWVYNAIPATGTTTAPPSTPSTATPTSPTATPPTTSRPEPGQPVGPNGPLIGGGLIGGGGGLIDIYRRRKKKKKKKKDCSALVYLDRIEIESEGLDAVMGEFADETGADAGKVRGPDWDVTVSINDARASWSVMQWKDKQTKSQAGNIWDEQVLKEGCGGAVAFVYQVTVETGSAVGNIPANVDNADADLTKTYPCVDGTRIEERLTVVLGLGEKGPPGQQGWARFTFVFLGDTVCGVRPGTKTPQKLWRDPNIDPDEQERIDRQALDQT